MRASRIKIFTVNPLKLGFLIGRALSCQDFNRFLLTFGLNWGSFGRIIYKLEEKEKERCFAAPYFLPELCFLIICARFIRPFQSDKKATARINKQTRSN